METCAITVVLDHSLIICGYEANVVKGTVGASSTYPVADV